MGIVEIWDMEKEIVHLRVRTPELVLFALFTFTDGFPSPRSIAREQSAVNAAALDP